MIRRLTSWLRALYLSRRPQPTLALANGTTLALAAPAAAASDAATRTIEGLIVPYGPIGQTSAGRLRFAAGSLRISNPARVKLLREHDQREPVAVGRSFEDVTAAEADRRLVALGREPLGVPGMWGRFAVPDGAAGDVALAEASSGLRDAFSVGVQLDDPVAERLRRAQGAAVDGAGQLREVSLVSVPAFDDARVGAAAHADLVVSAWADPIPTGGTMRCTHCGQEHAAGVACPTQAQAATAQATTTTTAPPVPAQAAPAGGDPAAAPAAATTTASAAPSTQGATTPDPAPLAVAGAALVTTEPTTYTFDGTGPSLVVDAWQARMHGNAEAHQRLQRFNAELVNGNPASVMALAAVITRDDTAPLLPQGYRPDLMVRAINVRRPIVSHLAPVRLTNAQPFSVPIEGEFDGVADHVEGTAHAPEGTLTVDGDTVTPKSVSGAFRLSRELIDQSNPAIDRIALNAMGRDYARKSEDKAIAALVAKNDGAPALNVVSVAELRAAIDSTMDDDDVSADFAALGKTLMSTIKLDVDADGRPLIGAVNPSNAAGTVRGRASYDVDGVEVFRASRLTATDGFVVHGDGVLWGESSVLTFRFDEVEGPGIIKLALWAYNVARVLKSDAVKRITTAAA